MFKYIERFFVEISKKRTPVLIIDELQVIGDLKVDDLLIYKLFNFFIRLTKELHLAHVFAISSDSLFIEDVHSEAMLEDRCRYLLVDDFDRETTTAFLEEYGLSDEEKELVWHHCGGKPICLVELVNAEEREKKVNGMLTLRTGEIETRLKLVKELGDEMMIGSRCCDVSYEKLASTLKMFLTRDEIGMNEVDEISKRYLVKGNILFVDPLTTMMKPQSRMNLLAIREVMKDV
jgi:AAA+ ATPase superfamily predicted ATPase